MIFSHVKITCYLHTRKDHRCCGYIINCAFCSIIKLTWYFIGVYIINRTLHDCLEIRNFSSRVEKYFTRLRNIFQHLKRYFIPLRSHVISSIYVRSSLRSPSRCKFITGISPPLAQTVYPPTRIVNIRH